MTLRSSTYLKHVIGNLKGTSNFTTSTSPKMKAVSPAIDLERNHAFKARVKRGDFVPVCVAIGMIVVSSSFGIYTAMRELASAPNVYVKKSRRETIPEIVEPEHVAEESEKFIKKSFFRKVAHLKDKTRGGDVFSRPPRVETLKDIGVDRVSHQP